MRNSPRRHVLAILRLELQLGQKEMAQVVGCSRATIQAVELGHLQLSESLAMRIAIETGVDVKWLLDNKLSAPIRPYGADEIEEWRLRHDGVRATVVYTPDIFEHRQAQKSFQEFVNLSDVYSDQLLGLHDHARMRAIIESARGRQLEQLARYKLDKFLEQMEEEFGANNDVFTVQPSRIESLTKAVAFVENEVKWASRSIQIKQNIETLNWNPTRVSDLERIAEAMRLASPYDKISESDLMEKADSSLKDREEMLNTTLKMMKSGQWFEIMKTLGTSDGETIGSTTGAPNTANFAYTHKSPKGKSRPSHSSRKTS